MEISNEWYFVHTQISKFSTNTEKKSINEKKIINK